ncbi:kinase-like domain-containing protein [Aspergillus egyptiacus]|nr:kinase-like domain-containing protein [Aspergillus egyptiacus]
MAGEQPSQKRTFTSRGTRPSSEGMGGEPSEVEQLFRYTSGRWLWDEEQQLKDRYKSFNVSQLQSVAAQALGAKACNSISKLAEGGFNKVFRLQMDDGRSILARIPNPNAGPAFYTTASEVATMEFARDVLQIPVPQVIGWSATADNPVGSEYILMEEAIGAQFASVWDELAPGAKLAIMKEVVAIEAKMVSVSLSHYGSIYFAKDCVEGAVPAQITRKALDTLKDHVAKTFTIGPTVERDFWKKERSNMDISRGPWSSSTDFALSIGRREVEWIKRYAVPKAPDDIMLVSDAQNNPQVHLDLLHRYLDVVPYLMDISPEFSQPTLWHGDLHSSNIFIQDNRITAVIDWQGSWAGPLFLQAQPSPLVDYQGELLLSRPDNFDELNPDTQAQIKRKIFKSTLSQLYLLETERQNPLLAKVLQMDYGKTRRLPVQQAGNTWDDDIVGLRESLIQVEKLWQDLGTTGNCPYHFTEEELKNHLADADGWNEVQDFFDSIEDLVQRDGWTHHETFEQARRFFEELREVGLKRMKCKKEREIFDKQTAWARSRK